MFYLFTKGLIINMSLGNGWLNKLLCAIITLHKFSMMGKFKFPAIFLDRDRVRFCGVRFHSMQAWARWSHPEMWKDVCWILHPCTLCRRCKGWSRVARLLQHYDSGGRETAKNGFLGHGVKEGGSALFPVLGHTHACSSLIHTFFFLIINVSLVRGSLQRLHLCPAKFLRPGGVAYDYFEPRV